MGKKKSIDKNVKANLFVKNVLDVFQSNPVSSFNHKQVSARLGVNDTESRELIKGILEKLVENGDLVQTKRGKYQINRDHARYRRESSNLIAGSIDMKQTGKAYVIPDDKSEDIFIAAGNTGHALHGDKVKVLLFPKRKGKKTEGQVV